jgi:hypothetical protein
MRIKFFQVGLEGEIGANNRDEKPPKYGTACLKKMFGRGKACFLLFASRLQICHRLYAGIAHGLRGRVEVADALSGKVESTSFCHVLYVNHMPLFH